jgi:hypothetical protein
MAITVTLAGVDRSSWIDWASLQITQIMGAEIDTAAFMMRNYGSRTAPEIGDSVAISDGTNTLLGGIITRVTNRWEAGLPYLDIEAADYGRVLDRYLVAGEFSNHQAAYIINVIVADYVNVLKKVVASFEASETWVQET